MEDIILILILAIAWIIVFKLWKRMPYEESLEVKSFKVAQYCNDDCLNCEYGNWCTFSEVKQSGKKTGIKRSADPRG